MLHYLGCISQGPALQECTLISCPLSYRQRWDDEEIQVRLVESFTHRLSSQCYSVLPGVCGNNCSRLRLVPACSQCDNASILGTTRANVKQVVIKERGDQSSTGLSSLMTRMNSCWEKRKCLNIGCDCMSIWSAGSRWMQEETTDPFHRLGSEISRIHFEEGMTLTHYICYERLYIAFY